MKGIKKKAYWERKRAQNAAARAAEKKANTQRLYKKPRGFVELKPKPSRVVITDAMRKVAALPSGPSHAAPEVKERRPVVDEDRVEEMKAREATARKIAERKKKQVAPLYNKGGLQYIGDAPPEIIETLGRKV